MDPTTGLHSRIGCGAPWLAPITALYRTANSNSRVQAVNAVAAAVGGVRGREGRRYNTSPSLFGKSYRTGTSLGYVSDQGLLSADAGVGGGRRFCSEST
jgi:hypothetical protein